eukprot:gene8144-8337_t
MVLQNRQASRTQNTTNPIQAAAYASSLSDAQLQALSSAASTEAAAAEQGLQALVNQMVNENIIRQTAEVNGVLAGCLVSRLDAAHYPEQVKVSFTMQYYKQPSFQHKMVQSILNCNKTVPIELLDVAIWAQYAYNTSGLVIPVISDNIHEARAFNRLARMARGEIIISAQDDHQYPDSCEWLTEALRVFKAYPRMGLLGLRRRAMCNYNASFIFSSGAFHDAQQRLDFMFAHKVDASPFALRASVYHELGGWDETASAKGMCGIISDWDLSMRAWAAGHWVGYLNNPPHLSDVGQSNSRELLLTVLDDDGGKQPQISQLPEGVGIRWIDGGLCGTNAAPPMFAIWPKEMELELCKRALQLNCQLLQLRQDKAVHNETEKCRRLISRPPELPGRLIIITTRQALSTSSLYT